MILKVAWGYTVNSLLAWPAVRSCLKQINKKMVIKIKTQGEGKGSKREGIRRKEKMGGMGGKAKKEKRGI